MANIFFTSDWHLSHKRIIEYCNRPFSSVEEMNERIIENHNQVVKANDISYNLGDFSFHMKPKEVSDILGRLNGKIHIILGNHDRREYFSEALKSLKEGKLVLHYRILELSGQTWHPYMPTLSHYPQLSWNGSFHGAFHLHGHTHGTIPFDNTVRRLDVGVDNWDFKPVPWESVVKILSDVQTPKEQKELVHKAGGVE